MKIPFIKHLLTVSFLLVFSLSSALKAADVPIIAAAADLKFALPEIAEAFRQDTGKEVRISYGSTGNMTRQIQQGAPFELFLAADKLYIEQLQQQHLAKDASFVYGLGRLVLLTDKNSPLKLDPHLNDLLAAIEDGRLQHFAIANPEHAPYGVAAQQALQHQELWSKMQPFLVLGENVAQAVQFASTGAAQGALVAYSLALAPELKDKTRFVLIPQNFHQPLEQATVLLKNAGDTAMLFYHYLQQNKVRQIFSRFGFKQS